jgi:Ca2+-binding EF-hand superfamily protein
VCAYLASPESEGPLALIACAYIYKTATLFYGLLSMAQSAGDQDGLDSIIMGYLIAGINISVVLMPFMEMEGLMKAPGRMVAALGALCCFALVCLGLKKTESEEEEETADFDRVSSDDQLEEIQSESPWQIAYSALLHQQLSSLFDRMDTDKSGQVSKDELLKALGESSAAETASEIFACMDADSSGQISRVELLDYFGAYKFSQHASHEQTKITSTRPQGSSPKEETLNTAALGSVALEEDAVHERKKLDSAHSNESTPKEDKLNVAVPGLLAVEDGFVSNLPNSESPTQYCTSIKGLDLHNWGGVDPSVKQTIGGITISGEAPINEVRMEQTDPRTSLSASDVQESELSRLVEKATYTCMQASQVRDELNSQNKKFANETHVMNGGGVHVDTSPSVNGDRKNNQRSINDNSKNILATEVEFLKQKDVYLSIRYTVYLSKYLGH